MDLAGVGTSARVPALHAGVERLLGTACVDREVCRALLRDPVGTARDFGLGEAEASLLEGIRAADLPGLARALLPRLRRPPSSAPPGESGRPGGRPHRHGHAPGLKARPALEPGSRADSRR